MPYLNQLVVLVEIFRRRPTPSAAQRAAIKRWFWRTTLTGYFSGWNTGQMASDLSGVEAFVGGQPEIALTEVAPTAEIWKVRQFRSNNAHAKMLGLMLAQGQPRDLMTGQQIMLEKALAWSNDREFHHFFPAAFLRNRQEAPPRIGCIANFVLMTSLSNKEISHKRPSEYLATCRSKLGSEFVSVAASNLISDKALDAAFADDFEAFLGERSRTLQERALSLAGW